MTLYIGLDGGGTRTTAVVIDERGVERSRVEGPPSLVPGARPERVAGVIASTVRDALERIEAGRAEVLCCALAGAGRTVERRRLVDALNGAGLAARIVITSDAEAALVDAFDTAPGVVLIAGTGSIAVGRTSDGALVRVGGWGEIMGDEGSGFALGIGALHAVAREADGRGPRTALTPEVLRLAGVREPADLIRWAAATAKGGIARLGPIVCEAARTGDAVADGLVEGAVIQLAEHVAAIVPRLGLEAEATAEVALAGGLLHEGSLVRSRLARRLASLRVRLVDRAVDAARGAARMAGAPT